MVFAKNAINIIIKDCIPIAGQDGLNEPSEKFMQKFLIVDLPPGGVFIMESLK